MGRQPAGGHQAVPLVHEVPDRSGCGLKHRDCNQSPAALAMAHLRPTTPPHGLSGVAPIRAHPVQFLYAEMVKQQQRTRLKPALEMGALLPIFDPSSSSSLTRRWRCVKESPHRCSLAAPRPPQPPDGGRRIRVVATDVFRDDELGYYKGQLAFGAVCNGRGCCAQCWEPLYTVCLGICGSINDGGYLRMHGCCNSELLPEQMHQHRRYYFQWSACFLVAIILGTGVHSSNAADIKEKLNRSKNRAG